MFATIHSFLLNNFKKMSVVSSECIVAALIACEESEGKEDGNGCLEEGGGHVRAHRPEGAERNLYWNVVIQGEPGKPHWFCETTLQDSRRSAWTCVLPAVCSKWTHTCWPICWMEPDKADKADYVRGLFLVTVFQTLFWNLFSASAFGQQADPG